MKKLTFSWQTQFVSDAQLWTVEELEAPSLDPVLQLRVTDKTGRFFRVYLTLVRLELLHDGLVLFIGQVLVVVACFRRFGEKSVHVLAMRVHFAAE